MGGLAIVGVGWGVNEGSVRELGVGRGLAIVEGWSEFQILYFLYFHLETELDFQITIITMV